MTLALVPVGARVLIRPDAVRDQTDSGLHLVEHWPDEVSGVVVAVGRPTHPRKAEACAAANRLEVHRDLYEPPDGSSHLTDAAQLLRELTGRDPAVAVGDRVLFSRVAGQDLQINDTRYVVMREADLLAVLEGADAV